MKKLLVLFLLVFIAACGSKEGSNSGNDSTNVADKFTETIDEPVVLKYNYKVGQKFAYRLTTISESKQKIEADTTITTDVDQTVKYEIGLTVNKVDTTGNSELSVVVNAVSLKSSLNGDITQYDSKVSPNLGVDNSIIDYRVLLNKPFVIELSKTGEVTNIKNVTKILDAFILHQFPGQPINPEQKKEIEARMNNGIIMPITQQLFKVLPNKEVNKDSVWTRNYVSPFAVFQTDNTVTFKVVGFNKDETSVKIDMNLVSIPTGNTDTTENGVNYKFEKPKVSGTGSIDFNYEKSMINKSSTETNISIKMSMEGKTADNKTSIVKRSDSTKNINIVEIL